MKQKLASDPMHRAFAVATYVQANQQLLFCPRHGPWTLNFAGCMATLKEVTLQHERMSQTLPLDMNLVVIDVWLMQRCLMASRRAKAEHLEKNGYSLLAKSDPRRLELTHEAYSKVSRCIAEAGLTSVYDTLTALLRGQFPSAEQGAPLVLLTRQNMNQPETTTP